MLFFQKILGTSWDYHKSAIKFSKFFWPLPPLKIFLNPYPPPTIFRQAHVWSERQKSQRRKSKRTSKIWKRSDQVGLNELWNYLLVLGDWLNYEMGIATWMMDMPTAIRLASSKRIVWPKSNSYYVVFLLVDQIELNQLWCKNVHVNLINN